MAGKLRGAGRPFARASVAAAVCPGTERSA